MVVTSFAEVDTDAKAVHKDGGGKAKETGLGRKVLPRQRFWLKFCEDDGYISIRRGYTTSCYYELLEMFIPYIYTLLIAR